MSYQPIEDYGITGNMRTVALVGMNGSIDCSTNSRFPSLTLNSMHRPKNSRWNLSSETGPSMVTAEERPIPGNDWGSWRNRRNGPKGGV
jgi:hypothetical protein